MYCYQCEQTAYGKACTNIGVCGKEPEVAALQDALVYAAQGLSMYAYRLREMKAQEPAMRKYDHAVMEALFTSVTNVNFDAAPIEKMVRETATLRDQARMSYEQECKKQGKTPENLTGPATWTPGRDFKALVNQGEAIAILARKKELGDDITGLQELVSYGVKGLAAYAHHAMVLGFERDNVYAFCHESMDALARKNPSVDMLFGYAMKTGAVNLEVMEMLDQANTGTYGHPEPSSARVTAVKGKAILVSGHDLKDLEELLKQTEGKGINVYTHGEMLPALAYPGLKKYKHLVGNYGGAWQDQVKEFNNFPGAVLMTTNCIQKPLESYKGRIFTSGLVGWPGVTHIKDRNFMPVIEAAVGATGFDKDEPEQRIMVGFARNAVLGVADKVIDAVKQGAIKHFFLVGGCDGSKSGRNYYTEFTQKAPEDTVILTLACGKFRFNKLEFGNIGGIPRLLDMGQCNDAYSAIQVAVALSKAFNVDVNSLPLSLVLSWYEQKAVAILLTLLHLGIKNIRLGPTLPAFVTEPVLKVLVEKFNIMPIRSATEDLKTILGPNAKLRQAAPAEV